MKGLYEQVLVLSPAFITVAIAGLANDVSLASTTVAAGTTAMLYKATKEVFKHS